MSELRFHLRGAARIHDIKPKRRHQAQQDGGRIAQRQRGGLRVAVQHLVLFGRLEVVVAMPGQLIQNDSADVRIGIPRVVRLHTFVSTGFQFVPKQPLVFDVVDAFEEQKCQNPCP